MPQLSHVATAPVLPSSPGRTTSKDPRFPVATAELERLAQAILAAARSAGASAAETEVSQAVGQSVTVRKGEV